MDIPGFVATIRGRYFAAAMISVVISMLSALAVTSDLLGINLGLSLDFEKALALAGILSLSSLGLAVKVLSDAGTLRQPIGLKIFTIVIIAEIASLLVVGFTIHERGDLSVLAVAALLGKIIAFVVVAWLLSAKVLPVVILLLQRFLNVPELSFGLLIGGLFLMVVGAEHMGLHGTIGALLFGAALSGLSQGVRDDIMPGLRSASEGLFVPLFFASAGLHFRFVIREPARIHDPGLGAGPAGRQVRRRLRRHVRHPDRRAARSGHRTHVQGSCRDRAAARPARRRRDSWARSPATT